MSTIYPNTGGQFNFTITAGTGTSTMPLYTTGATSTYTTTFTTVGPNWQASPGFTSTSGTLFQDYSGLATQWQVPDHFFNPDAVYGICTECDQRNMHRADPDAHVPVFNEEPDADDWWQLLAS